MTATVPKLFPKALMRLREDYPAEGFRARTNLHKEGDLADVVFLLDAGIVKLHRVAGDKSMLIRLMRPDDIWGEWAEDGFPRWRATAECMGPVRVHVIPVAEFRRACQRDPELAAWLARMLTRRLGEMERRMELLSFYRVEQRLLLSLAELADHCAVETGQKDYALPLTQTDLAALIGATRETVSTTLNSLERRGVLRLRRRSLEFTSPDQLRSAATGT